MANISRLPESWYWVGRDKKFGQNPVEVRLLHQKFVLYRKKNGSLVALNANCPHAGANMAKGRIEEDRLVCPFHAWAYGESGVCEKIPGTDCIPKFARVATFPVKEQHGMVFLYYGRRPKFDLPFFPGKDPNEFFCSPKTVTIYQDSHWWTVCANAWDLQHFWHVHNRVPRETPVYDYPEPYVANVTFKSKVAGKNLADRFMRLVSGEDVDLELTTYCGNLMLSVSKFGDVHNYMMSFNEQTGEQASVTHILFFSEGAKRSWFWRFGRTLRMILQAILSKNFFQWESDTLKDVDYNTRTLHPNDADLKRVLEWLEKVTNEPPLRDDATQETLSV